jgi:hypothetical protein
MSMARVRVEKTFKTFFVPGTHAIGSRTIAETQTGPIACAAMRGTMISIAPTKTSLPDVVLRQEATMREESRLSLVT